MSDAIKKLHDYLAKSPSVVYPEDVLAYLPAIEDENVKLRELVADMWFWHYEGHIDSESQERQMLHIDAVIQRMRELGVEVE